MKLRFSVAALALGAMLALGACGNRQESAQQRAFVESTSLNTALAEAKAYVQLPRCSAAITANCSEAATIHNLRVAAEAADAADKKAQAAAKAQPFDGAAYGAAAKEAREKLDAFVALLPKKGA